MTLTSQSSSKVSNIAGGQAEPPMIVRFMVLNFRSLFCTCVSRPCQTVGTPAETVTPSASNSSYRLLPSRPGPGNTSLAPTMQAEYGKPQALTWNIGTTGSTASRELRFSESGKLEPRLCNTVERCEYRTPLGLPVVPLV